MKGSMTVEASLVFPFCFLVIVLVCCLGIFKYNQTILKLTGYECVIHTMDLRDGAEQVLQETIKNRTGQMAKERALGVENLETSVKVTASKISVTCSGTQKLLRLPLNVNVVYERVYPEQLLRLLSGNAGE